MRELKFRHYNLFAGEMLYSDKHFHNLGDYFASREYDSSEEMQFAGLKDRNGVDVYKGDIVKAFTVFGMVYDYKFSDDNEPTHIYQIEFADGCFQFKNTKQWSDGSNDWRSIENVELFKVEVIGNIYENSELLESK